MENKDNVINIEPPKKTISFWELLKLKIANQKDELSKFFTYTSFFLASFSILMLNSNYVEIGMHSRTLANQTGNFWIVLLLILPFIFLTILSLIFCLISKFKKTEFIGKVNFYYVIFNFFVLLFFWIYISAIF
ncbi:MAG: hypothetical protein IJW82_08170 [Clostridia bacterium]|nr:hypothetical protein [Clostridia bacterium]